MEPAHLRVKEAAVYLGVSPSTMNNWRVAGRGPVFCKFGRAVAYAVEDLDAWKRDHRHTGTHVLSVPKVNP